MHGGGGKTHKKKKYKKEKRAAKKAVAEAKDRTFEAFYQKHDTKEGEKYIFKLEKVRSRQKNDLGTVKFIKDEGGRVLLRQEDIKMRWHPYFSQLVNETRCPKKEIRQTSDIQRTQDHGLIIDITTVEVGEALKRMGGSKAVGPNNISIKVWRGLVEEEIHWLTNLFNDMLRSSKMFEQWRVSTLMPLFKNKDNAQV